MPITKILDNPDQWVAYFGYGSLVNDRTRNLESFGLAGRLEGFRRQWRMRSGYSDIGQPRIEGVTSLSVECKANAYCDGLLVFDHKDHLPQVDIRETNYDRVSLDLTDFDCNFDIPAGVEAYIYIGQPDYTQWAEGTFPVLQSYVDAVMQGFLDKFGQGGLSASQPRPMDGGCQYCKIVRARFIPAQYSLVKEKNNFSIFYCKRLGGNRLPFRNRRTIFE